MKNYLYQITNRINNKIYVGVHKTNNIDDGYMGSGKIIKRAIKKYGIENFTKEILEYFDTYDQALAREAEIVDDDFLLREDIYNLRRGGTGGFDYINRTMSREKRIEISTKGAAGRDKISVEDKKSFGKLGSAVSRTSTAQKLQYAAGRINGFLEKSHSKETKDRIGKENSFNQLGNKNSQFGTRWAWVNKNGIIKKIKLSLLDDYLTDNWKRGTK